jgi:anti-sigma regulatory factor (Ser/Thr protein kinase)
MTHLTAEHRISPGAGASAPGTARRWLDGHLAHLGLPTRIGEDARLVLSELVTNAIRHGRPEIDVTLSVRPDRLRIAVHDGGERLPVLNVTATDSLRAGGRGLMIVAATAVDWGVLADGTGKTVWAEIAVG